MSTARSAQEARSQALENIEQIDTLLLGVDARQAEWLEVQRDYQVVIITLSERIEKLERALWETIVAGLPGALVRNRKVERDQHGLITGIRDADPRLELLGFAGGDVDA